MSATRRVGFGILLFSMVVPSMAWAASPQNAPAKSPPSNASSIARPATAPRAGNKSTRWDDDTLAFLEANAKGYGPIGVTWGDKGNGPLHIAYGYPPSAVLPRKAEVVEPVVSGQGPFGRAPRKGEVVEPVVYGQGPFGSAPAAPSSSIRSSIKAAVTRPFRDLRWHVTRDKPFKPPTAADVRRFEAQVAREARRKSP